MQQLVIASPTPASVKPSNVKTAKRPNFITKIALMLASIRIITGVLLTFIGVHFVKQGPYGPVTSLAQGLMMWDSVWYRWVAMYGYNILHTRALFPGYPLAIHITAIIVRNYTLSALLVSWISVFFATKGLMRLSEYFKASTSQQVLAAMAFLWFPVSAFLVAGYAESFFMAFLSWATYYMLQKRWFYCAILSFGVVGTRPEGIVILAVLGLYMLLNHQGFVKSAITSSLAATSFLGYIIFLWAEYRKPLSFLNAVKYWDMKRTLPLAAEFISIYRMSLHKLTWPGLGSPFNAYSLYITDDILAFLAVGASLYCLYRAIHNKSWLVPGIYGVLVVVVAYSFSPYGGVSPDAAGRIAMSVPAIYIMISQLKPKFTLAVIIPVFIITAVIWEIAFASGYWLT